ncbi:hypothetical protein PCANC_15466 [Puccinia coronata f. sp. avenae]|uniref:Uncharacterized protein n=1 Tax=Puccinia coronata f. sp. avenae TaxID=200324 RepID=A0A2N5RVZ3_9BASI|nr:hypothetical protein PCASD_26752 [Puccinia coronata f. sp. avenae]PLW48680.1 hypothetical protein PCANC_15466 [Puccinia coronata f. sp. avenae]
MLLEHLQGLAMDRGPQYCLRSILASSSSKTSSSSSPSSKPSSPSSEPSSSSSKPSSPSSKPSSPSSQYQKLAARGVMLETPP